MRLNTPLKFGFRRPFTITPDAPVDKNDAGSFLTAESVLGDSTVTIDDANSTPTSIKGYINGDGSVGEKAIRFTADGRVGEGVVPVTLDVEFEVVHPDATTLGFAEGPDEPIPAT